MHVPGWAERLFERIQDRTARIMAFLQPIVVAVLLALVYVIGVGLTRLTCAIAFRHALKMDRAVESGGSFWRDAEGYEPDHVRLRKQI